MWTIEETAVGIINNGVLEQQLNAVAHLLKDTWNLRTSGRVPTLYKYTFSPWNKETYLTNQDSYFGPNGVRIREVTLYLITNKSFLSASNFCSVLLFATFI